MFYALCFGGKAEGRFLATKELKQLVCNIACAAKPYGRLAQQQIKQYQRLLIQRCKAYC